MPPTLDGGSFLPVGDLAVAVDLANNIADPFSDCRGSFTGRWGLDGHRSRVARLVLGLPYGLEIADEIDKDASGEDEELEKGAELVELGADSVSALIGAGVGLALGPGGALIGAAAGPTVTRVLRWAGAEIRVRLLSPKEEIRIGTALTVAAARIQQRQEAGEQPRQDGLFDPGEDPEGLLEGTLLSAARAYQEKKVPFVGAFYASFAFHEEISPETAHYLLGLLDRLTYHQLCALAFIGDSERMDERNLIQATATEDGDKTPQMLIAEINELANLGLVGYVQAGGEVSNPLGTWGSEPIRASTMANTTTSELGSTLVKMAELDMLPVADVEAIGVALRGDQ